MNSLPQMWIQSILVRPNPIFILVENPKQSELGGWNQVNEIGRLEYEAPFIQASIIITHLSQNYYACWHLALEQEQQSQMWHNISLLLVLDMIKYDTKIN